MYIKEVIGVNLRIKELRNAVGLTQTEFAEKLGLSRNAIASYEGGIRTPNDAIIKLMCRTFNVDYFWLTEGKNEMFSRVPDTIAEKLAKDYNLDNFGLEILKAYSIMKPDQKKALKDFLVAIADKVKNEG